VALIEDRHWEIGPLELDLYNGLPGVALFLTHLGAMSGQARWTTLAQAAVATLQRYIVEEMEAEEEAFAAIGVFNGLGGLLYTLAHLAGQWQRPDLLQTASKLVSLTQDRAGEEEEGGLAHGIAGYLVGLLALHQVAATPKTGAVAQKWGDYLLQKTQPGWSRPLPVLRSFASFWHGRMGVAWALLALANKSGQSRFRRAALAMIEEKLALEQGLAATDGPGAALGYLRVLPYISEVASRALLRNRLEIGLQMTLAHSFGLNHSLGHGDLGCLDLLLQTSKLLDDNYWYNYYTRQATAMITGLQHRGWVTAIPLGVESPGLMTGLAGIGYGLLRLADPGRVPSVLALELPRK
jgi:lantibiotic modifying enzyme